METPRFSLSFFTDDFTTEEMKLVAKCNILLTGLSSGLLLRTASIPCSVVITAFAFAKFSSSGAIVSAILIAYFDATYSHH